MGCDIAYYLDHDFPDMTPKKFLSEFKKRAAPLDVTFTGWGDSPYPDIQKIKIENSWIFYCYDTDYKSAFSSDMDFTIKLYTPGNKHRWIIYPGKKIIELFFEDDDLGFIYNRRWWSFVEYHLSGLDKDYEIINRINTTLAEIKKFIIPIFHSTKMIAIGDQGSYQAMESDFAEGKTIAEALNNSSILKNFDKIKVYKHGSDELYKGDNKELPVWMFEFSELDRHKFWIKVEEIFKITGKGQVIVGETNCPFFMGKVCCNHKTFEIIGCEILHDYRDKISSFLVNTFNLSDDYKGKIFTSMDFEGE